jgi:23S rRNA (cytosine1962-C5)-methyltransferase
LLAHSKGLRVLNLFAYTGSLSIAAGRGGAESVTTIDLSKATMDWARENWALNHLESARGRFFAGDVFEELPRLERRKELFERIVLDPPSFSRGKKGTFSTQKDWGRLHDRVLPLLAPGGILVSSMNSAQIPQSRVEDEIHQAAHRLGLRLQVLRRIDLPETFPTETGMPEERYLKGAYFRLV